MPGTAEVAAGTLRVVMVVPGFPKLSETFIVGKFLGLLDAGFDVRVVCARSDPAEWSCFPALDERPGVRERVLVGPPLRPRWRAGSHVPGAYARSVRDAPGATGRYLVRRGARGVRGLYLDAGIVRARPDLLHFEFGTLALGRTYLREALGCRLVVSFRGFDLNFAGLETPGYFNEVWAAVDGVHVLGEDLWARALRRGCPSDVPHALIPPAVDVSRFDPGPPRRAEVVGTPHRPLRLLSVGRLEWKKGYEFALQAVGLLRDRGLTVDYRIVGEGVHLEAVAFCRRQLELDDCVTLVGSLAPDDVGRELLWCDVFLHAAVSEGFCNAVMEAQAMKVPVVCSDADGLPENVDDGVTGSVVPRRDPVAMADAVARLAGDPGLRARMGAAGRRRVAQRFRPADAIAAFGRFYRQVVSHAY